MNLNQKIFIFMLFSIGLFLIGCTPKSGSVERFIPWNDLENPIYSHKGWSTKDACMIYKDNTFYLFFSAFFEDEGRIRCHISGVKTQDFRTFSEPLFIWRGKEGGWIGMASPDINKFGDTYYLTYNSWGDKKGQVNQLFYATSKDLENWENNKPLATNITAGIRAIDAAVTFNNNYYYLIYKEKQKPIIAYSNTMGAEGWTKIGTPAGGWNENGQFINIDGNWYLMSTVRGFIKDQHSPRLAQMVGDGSDPNDWLNWNNYIHINVPEENFNTNEKANAASITDWRQYDGHFYLLYAGRTEDKSFLGRGNNKLAIARSKDLKEWRVPPN